LDLHSLGFIVIPQKRAKVEARRWHGADIAAPERSRHVGAASRLWPVLSQQVAAWERARNAAATTVRWQFIEEDARIKMCRLYPEIHHSSG